MVAKLAMTPEKRAGALSMLKRQIFTRPPLITRNDADLDGKTAIITGSNSGLGLECARQLLDLGLSRLILAVRNESKGEAALRDLMGGRTTKHVIEVWKVDVSSYESIMSFVERTKALDRLDIVVLNAAVFKLNANWDPVTAYEETIQVNYLGMALLAIQLLPIIQGKNSPQEPGRIVIVSSDSSAFPAFRERSSRPLLGAFKESKRFDGLERYGVSKLLGQMFLAELARRVPPSVAVVNAANPGFCRSNLHHEYKIYNPTGLIVRIFGRLIGYSSSVGARPLTDAAVNHGPDSHGHCVDGGQLQPMAPLVYSSEGAGLSEVLWEETMEQLAFSRAQEIVDRFSVATVGPEGKKANVFTFVF